jgi:hypothetical protein
VNWRACASCAGSTNKGVLCRRPPPGADVGRGCREERRRSRRFGRWCRRGVVVHPALFHPTEVGDVPDPPQGWAGETHGTAAGGTDDGDEGRTHRPPCKQQPHEPLSAACTWLFQELGRPVKP